MGLYAQPLPAQCTADVVLYFIVELTITDYGVYCNRHKMSSVVGLTITLGR